MKCCLAGLEDSPRQKKTLQTPHISLLQLLSLHNSGYVTVKIFHMHIIRHYVL